MAILGKTTWPTDPTSFQFCWLIRSVPCSDRSCIPLWYPPDHRGQREAGVVGLGAHLHFCDRPDSFLPQGPARLPDPKRTVAHLRLLLPAWTIHADTILLMWSDPCEPHRNDCKLLIWGRGQAVKQEGGGACSLSSTPGVRPNSLRVVQPAFSSWLAWTLLEAVTLPQQVVEIQFWALRPVKHGAS